jgi:hypothetical protein
VLLRPPRVSHEVIRDLPPPPGSAVRGRRLSYGTGLSIKYLLLSKWTVSASLAGDEVTSPHFPFRCLGSGFHVNRTYNVRTNLSVPLRITGFSVLSIILWKTQRFGNWICFRNVVLFQYLEYRTVNKALKPSDSVCYTPSWELKDFQLMVLWHIGT